MPTSWSRDAVGGRVLLDTFAGAALAWVVMNAVVVFINNSARLVITLSEL